MQDQEYRRTEGVGLSRACCAVHRSVGIATRLTTPSAFAEPKRKSVPKAAVGNPLSARRSTTSRVRQEVANKLTLS